MLVYEEALPFIIIDNGVKRLCKKPYLNYKIGCPKLYECQGDGLGIRDVVDLRQSLIVWSVFNIDEFVEHKTPQDLYRYWTYWRQKRRSLFLHDLEEISCMYPSYACVDKPEAFGVDVDATMRNMGIRLEWPPRKVCYSVAVVGKTKLFW